MSTSIESRLRRAYLANGGTEEEFKIRKGELIAQYRNQVTINAAIEEANKPLTMNEIIRGEFQGRRDEGLERIFRKPGDEAA